MLKKVGRRDFIKTAGIAGAALAGGSLLAGCSNAASPNAGDVKWDEETDVLVVGTGFAGLAAAIEAKKAGADVLVIEKMPTTGGNSAINGGDMAAVGTKLQEDAGVEDSIDSMVKDMLVAGLFYNHVDRVKMVAEKSKEAIEWCTDLGVQFTKLNFHGGHSVPRTNTTVNATGADIVKAELAKLDELGIPIKTNVKLVKFISDEDERVVGIEARDGYKIGDEESGNTVFIKAKKAVVLASGGFSNDLQMRVIHEPRLTEELTSTNHQGATGEALREALKLKAMDVHMDWIQLGPWTSPDEKGFGFAPQFCERLVGHAPMIDPETGKRFINETGNRKVRADAMLALGRDTIILGDADAVARQVVLKTLESGMKNGVIREFNSLEELAAGYNIPVGPFMAEIKRWNSFVANKKDEDFGCMIFDDAGPTQKAPFYATKLWPKVHHTMGGLVTNLQSQVINQDYEPIKGLYAAGEVTGGTHGAVRLGSCAITDCIVFGRIAGQEAAKEQV